MKFHFAAAGLALAISGALAGYVYGLKSAGKNAGSYDGPLSCNPEDAPVTKAQRNIVWRTLNADESVPDSPEKNIGAMISAVVSPKSEQQLRNMGLVQYLQKSAVYLSDDEIAETRRPIEIGSSLEILGQLRRIHAADTRAGRLVRAILADQERMKRLVQGEPIPLEP